MASQEVTLLERPVYVDRGFCWRNAWLAGSYEDLLEGGLGAACEALNRWHVAPGMGSLLWLWHELRTLYVTTNWACNSAFLGYSI